MTNILITGGAGFIGANYVFYHKEHYPDDLVVVLDKCTYASNVQTLDPFANDPNFVFIKGDILDAPLVEQIISKYNIKTLVHFAAESHVDRSISGPDDFINTNINGTYNLLKVCKKLWIDPFDSCQGRFHHISTDEVFGTLSLQDEPFNENTPYKPNSPYSASKAASDCLVRSFVHTYGLDATETNCSNNYGPRQFPEKLIPLMIINIINNKPLPIYGDGMQIRDWLHVYDHARAIDLAIKNGKSGQTWNIGGRAERTNLQIVNTICSICDNLFNSTDSYFKKYPKSVYSNGASASDLITHVQDRPGHDRRYAINPNKAQIELGFKPSYSFEQGIEQTVRWYLDNDSWWLPLTERLIDFSKR